jgi:hypothetical protein
MRIWGAIRDSISVLAQDSRPSLFPEAPVERRHVSSRRCFLVVMAAVVCKWFGVLLMGLPSRRSRAPDLGWSLVLARTAFGSPPPTRSLVAVRKPSGSSVTPRSQVAAPRRTA